MEEKLIILKETLGSPSTSAQVMNSCDEIYGACRHNTKFHQLTSMHSCRLCLMEDSDSDSDSDSTTHSDTVVIDDETGTDE